MYWNSSGLWDSSYPTIFLQLDHIEKLTKRVCVLGGNRVITGLNSFGNALAVIRVEPLVVVKALLTTGHFLSSFGVIVSFQTLLSRLEARVGLVSVMN